MPLSPWSPTSLSATAVVLAVHGGTAYAGLDDGRVLRSLDGVRSWQVVTEVEAPGALLATPDALLLASAGGLHRLPLGGPVTAAAGLPAAADVVTLAWAGGVAVAGTQGHGVFRSEDDGASWADANRGLPFNGVGLGVSGFAATRTSLFVSHALGVSRSRDAGRGWEMAGAGLPLRLGRLAVVASGSHVFAEADRRLYHLDGEAWVGCGVDPVVLLGADRVALYGIDGRGHLVWRSPGGGAWADCGDGLPGVPRALVSSATWRLAALASGELWHRSATDAPSASASPRLDDVPPFLAGGPATVIVTLHAPTSVVLSLVDGADEEVARLLDGGPLRAGVHRLTVTATGVAAGLYRCRLTTEEHVVSRPVAVLPHVP